MISLAMQIPISVWVATSGGVDSMALLSFLSKRKTPPKVAFFHHGTETSELAFHFLKDYCTKNNLEFVHGRITKEKPADESPEEFWRNERYAFLDSLPGTICTAHHLDDCVEQWIFSSLHGKPGIIPSTRGRIIRPLLLTKKEELINWCLRHDVSWLEDASNKDTKYMRNKIRNDLMPHVLQINPGIQKVVRKIVLASLEK